LDLLSTCWGGFPGLKSPCSTSRFFFLTPKCSDLTLLSPRHSSPLSPLHLVFPPCCDVHRQIALESILFTQRPFVRKLFGLLEPLYPFCFREIRLLNTFEVEVLFAFELSFTSPWRLFDASKVFCTVAFFLRGRQFLQLAVSP